MLMLYRTNTMRARIFVLLLILTAFAPCAGLAGESGSLVGKAVIAKTPDVALRIGKIVQQGNCWGTVFYVRLAHGSWLWVGRGWLRDTDVVTCDEAEAYFTRDLEAMPSAFALISRGVARQQRRELESARADFDAARRLAPGEPRLYRERARVFSPAEKKAAMRDLNTAIELSPNDATMYISRGLAFALQSSEINWNDLRMALDDFARAIRLAPGDPEAYATRSLVLYHFGKLEAALPDAAEAIRLDPWYAPNYTHRAAVYLALGQRALAAADFDFAERLNPASKGMRKLYERGVLRPRDARNGAPADGYSSEHALSRHHGEVPRAVAEPPGPSVIDEFNIGRGPNPVILPIVVEGTTLHFLVDSGTRMTAVSTVHQALLGKKSSQVRARTFTGRPSISVHHSVPLALGRTVLRPPWGTACIDLRKASLLAGTALDGILGTDVLRAIILSIDFDHGTASVLSSADVSCGAPLRLIWHKQLRFNDEGPFVMARLNGGAPAEFLVDLGQATFYSGMLSPDLFDSEVSAGRLKTIGGPKVLLGTIDDGSLESVVARSRQLSVAGHELNGLIFGRSAGVNVLGVEYLSRYAVTLDLANDTMYLRPGKDFDRPEIEDNNGLSFLRHDGDLRIAIATRGSPAERAGCRSKDIVTRIDGTPAREFRFIADVERALCVPGRHALSLLRDDVTYEVTFVQGN